MQDLINFLNTRIDSLQKKVAEQQSEIDRLLSEIKRLENN